ncbi:MAG: HAD-IIIC family phosphatase, partial [Anaerolineae bacterium]|nr:HAD-IIIC family phosphatase [Anaerolineae bacterium]
MNALEQAGSRIVPFLQQIFPSRRFNGMCTHVRRNVIRKLSSSHQLPVAQKKERTDADLVGSVPDAFYVKCFSPESIDFRIVIELVTDAPVFRTSLQITPGWNEHLIDAAELFERADGKAGRIQVSIENDQEVRLIFSWLDLVHLKNASALLPKSQAPAPDHEQPAEKIKCVAWDLDNTLWHGVIGDAGPDGVTVNEQMVHLVREFDRRGILQTIASKNNYETAWPKIVSMGLADYFLYPAINWSPKSQNLKQIASELNINIDTFAFVDDSEFERHEVSSVLPQVRVFDPLQGPEFANHPEFDLPVSSESSSRRLSYLAESKRRQISQSFRGDYDRFLKSCGMSMTIRKPGRQEQPRCL